MKNKRHEYLILIVIFFIFILANIINTFCHFPNLPLNKGNIIINFEDEKRKDYDELLKYHNLINDNKLNLILSKIKYRNIYEFSNIITIYKGFKDGIKTNSAVLVDEGLIGIVEKTYDNSSEVKLLTNHSSEISVKINESFGVLKCLDGEMVVGEINNYESIKVGDMVYTSGLGNLPGNIYIGKVSEVSLNKTEIEQVIKVELGANLNKINYVFVYGDNND